MRLGFALGRAGFEILVRARESIRRLDQEAQILGIIRRVSVAGH
jgi:hypothetical protein